MPSSCNYKLTTRGEYTHHQNRPRRGLPSQDTQTGRTGRRGNNRASWRERVPRLKEQCEEVLACHTDTHTPTGMHTHSLLLTQSATPSMQSPNSLTCEVRTTENSNNRKQIPKKKRSKQQISNPPPLTSLSPPWPELDWADCSCCLYPAGHKCWLPTHTTAPRLLVPASGHNHRQSETHGTSFIPIQ